MSEPIPKSATHVIVGCKIINGLILSLKEKGQEEETYTIKGANTKRVVGGYGLTEGIPADFMQRWLAKNARHPAVKARHIFIHGDVKGAEAFAKEHRDVMPGLAAIDPVKSGMLNSEHGTVDRKALADYERQKAENPDRGLQVQE